MLCYSSYAETLGPAPQQRAFAALPLRGQSCVAAALQAAWLAVLTTPLQLCIHHVHLASPLRELTRMLRAVPASRALRHKPAQSPAAQR